MWRKDKKNSAAVNNSDTLWFAINLIKRLSFKEALSFSLQGKTQTDKLLPYIHVKLIQYCYLIMSIYSARGEHWLGTTTLGDLSARRID